MNAQQRFLRDLRPGTLRTRMEAWLLSGGRSPLGREERLVMLLLASSPLEGSRRLWNAPVLELNQAALSIPLELDELMFFLSRAHNLDRVVPQLQSQPLMRGPLWLYVAPHMNTFLNRNFYEQPLLEDVLDQAGATTVVRRVVGVARMYRDNISRWGEVLVALQSLSVDALEVLERLLEDAEPTFDGLPVSHTHPQQRWIHDPEQLLRYCEAANDVL